jgi:hypothetical protein
LLTDVGVPFPEVMLPERQGEEERSDEVDLRFSEWRFWEDQFEDRDEAACSAERK